MNAPFMLLTQPSEVLAISIGRINGEFIVVVSCRIGDTFESTNLAFSPAQAHRLLEDLQRLIGQSKVLSQVAGDDQARRAFERILGGE